MISKDKNLTFYSANIESARGWAEVGLLDSQLQYLNQTFIADNLSRVEEEAYEIMRKTNRAVRNRTAIDTAKLNNN